MFIKSQYMITANIIKTLISFLLCFINKQQKKFLRLALTTTVILTTTDKWVSIQNH